MNAQTMTKQPGIQPASPAEMPGLYAHLEQYFKELFRSHQHIDKREYTAELLRLDLEARFGVTYPQDEIHKQCKICFTLIRPGVFRIHRYDFNQVKN